ncbi:MAG: phosphoenolpyruvate--protein phosphotransferase [Rhodospirillales bacterium CG15_BIG_FIL_POST_REV_8_21_14_020_66_15]|nr:MAG: phosphoenolpyruvate--protein phosphotransferase [Rhodospirillales bacterium CG15_BIG_FIL_POST_REV_8_21_14_020_66_15]
MEKRFEGLGVSPGIAVGPAHVREAGTLEVPERRVAKKAIAAEQKRLAAAVILARRQLKRLKAQAQQDVLTGEMQFLFDAYLQMLEDSRLVRGARDLIRRQGLNAEAAVQNQLNDIVHAFQAMDNAYIAARVDDVRDVGNRIIRNLMREPLKPFSQAAPGSIVIADQLSPADASQLDPTRIAGAATALGGAEGHAAIMARALGIPLVLGIPGLPEAVKPGARIIVDGTRGTVIVNPTARTQAVYEQLKTAARKETERLGHMRAVPAVTRDNVSVSLAANVELPIELDLVRRNGAAGIGLLRTEFLYMSRDDVPTEDEQYATLKEIVEAMDGKTVTVRTLDIGGEKPAQGLLGDLSEAATSALGLRGIRLSLKHRKTMDAQMTAILRAACHGPVRILLPMVSTVSEVRQARDALQKAARKLKRRKHKLPDPLPPLGVMIEVPAAALAADALAQVSDFFAIGSNDLTMYTLATDRTNEHVAHLYDSLHPAVLRLIQFATQAALRSRIPISLCGEMAGDPRYAPLLLGLGLRELSMVAANIPVVKQRIREMDMAAANRRADAIMGQVDPGRIAALLDDFNGLA